MNRKKLLPAIVACFVLFLLGIFLLVGCAVRHTPGGGTAPATTFEQILVWNTALAQANDGIVDNVIGLQHAGLISVSEAKTILAKQGSIAQADNRVTARLKAATACAQTTAPASPSPAQLDAAAVTCEKGIPGTSLKGDLQLVLLVVHGLTSGNDLLSIKDPAKRQAILDLVASVETLTKQIFSALQTQGVIQ